MGASLVLPPEVLAYEVIPARRWRMLVCKCLIGFAVAIIFLGIR